MVLSALHHFGSLQRDFHVLAQDLFKRVVLSLDIAFCMQELAASPELAVTKFMEGLADFRLEVCGHVLLALQLVLSVGEGALVLELALTAELPIAAHLSLELHLVLLHEALSLLLALELLLGLLESTLLCFLSGGLLALSRAFALVLEGSLFFSDEILMLRQLGGILGDEGSGLWVGGLGVVTLQLLVLGNESWSVLGL